MLWPLNFQSVYVVVALLFLLDILYQLTALIKYRLEFINRIACILFDNISKVMKFKCQTFLPQLRIILGHTERKQIRKYIQSLVDRIIKCRHTKDLLYNITKSKNMIRIIAIHKILV